MNNSAMNETSKPPHHLFLDNVMPAFDALPLAEKTQAIKVLTERAIGELGTVRQETQKELNNLRSIGEDLVNQLVNSRNYAEESLVDRIKESDSIGLTRKY